MPSDRDRPRCRPLTLRAARRLPPIPSGYTTSQIYVLRQETRGEAPTWSLRREELPGPYTKRYDGGDVSEWLDPYLETVPREAIRFFVAENRDEPLGLITWQHVRWNNTVWLIDIRVQQGIRRQGVGSLLIERLSEEAGKLAVRGISVETQISNLPAINFYLRHQFRFVGFNDHLYTNQDMEKRDVALFLFRESPVPPS